MTRREIKLTKAVTESLWNLTFDPLKELTDDLVILLAKSRHYRIRQPLKTSDKVNLMIEYAKRGDFRKALINLERVSLHSELYPSHTELGG